MASTSNPTPIINETFDWVAQENNITPRDRNLYTEVKNLRNDPRNIADSEGIDIRIIGTKEQILDYKATISVELIDNVMITRNTEAIRQAWLNFVENKNESIKFMIKNINEKLLIDREVILEKIQAIYSGEDSKNDSTDSGLISLTPVNLSPTMAYSLYFEVKSTIKPLDRAEKVDDGMPGYGSHSYRLQKTSAECSSSLTVNRGEARLFIENLLKQDCKEVSPETKDKEGCCSIKIENCKNSDMAYTLTSRCNIIT